MSSTLEHDPRLLEEGAGLRGVLSEYGRRLRSGDIGPLPVVVALVVIGVIFQFASHGLFLTSSNLVNLTYQMSAGGMIAVGVVLVLLLGEIDLSAGVVSGMCAAIMGVLSAKHDMGPILAIAIALGAGLGVGLIQGLWSTRLGIPSFIVTLAGQLTWSGGLLWVLGPTGTINLRDPVITALATKFVNGAGAYAIGALFIVYVALGPLLTRARRKAAGLTVPPLAFVGVRAVVIAIVVGLVVFVLDAERGINTGLLFLVGAVIAVDFMLRRMRFGRMVYAVGGNPEAARRAGIPVRTVRTVVFMLASMFAAAGGILSASRSLSVGQSAGRGDLLLNAIAAAVIGGTSLFGGRGTVWSALLGMTVIQAISNGMDLLSLSPSIKFMITGGVLLVTVTIDAVLRRSGSNTGR